MKRAALAACALLTACGSGGAAQYPAGDAASAGETGAPDAKPNASDAPAGASDASDGEVDPCEDAGVPPSTLACTGLYADFVTKQLAPGAMAYTPSTPLWSDGAQKQRWIELPPNTQIDTSNPNEWTFPVGTKLFKEFRVDGKRVETRMFQKTTASFWVYATYAWNADDSEADINYGGPVPVGDGGTTWNIPTNDDCDECHRGRQDRILGFEQVGLGLSGAQGLTLAQLVEMNLLSPAPTSVSLAIGDDGTGLDSLALGWLHVNCGVTCHNANPTAAGYGSGMLLRLDPSQLDGSPPDQATWDILNTTIDVPCVSGSLVGQPRIQPRNPTASVIHELIDQRGALQMPPIASLVVDVPDVAVVTAWIQAMPVDGGVSPGDGGDGGDFPPDGGLHRFHDGGEAGSSDATATGTDGAADVGPPEGGPADGQGIADQTTPETGPEDAATAGDDGLEGDAASD